MFAVIGMMLSCLLLGYLLRYRAGRVLCSFSSGSMITVYALLFVMGLEVGANRNVAARILSIGWEALLISVAATMGSVLAAWAVCRLFFRKTPSSRPPGKSVLPPESSVCQLSSPVSFASPSSALSSPSCQPSTETSGKSSFKRFFRSHLAGSLKIVASFLVGFLAGWLSLRFLPDTFSLTTFVTKNRISTWLLYLLLAQVGLGVGSDPKLKEILKGARPRMLLIPAATIAGTLLFSLLSSVFISRWSVPEVLAVGSGFGYYSLSSVLITTLKESSIGAQAAAELGTLALIANIFREMATLVFAPVLAKVFGPAAPISAGGATTMDVTLPVISRVSGENWIVASMIHGFLVDFSVPWLVSFFCSL